MKATELSKIFSSVLELPPGKEQNEFAKRQKYGGYLKATEDFITFHSDLMRKHFLNEHFRGMSLEEQDLCWRFHWTLAFKAIANFKKLGKMPTKKWVMDMIHRISPGANHLFGLTAVYFLGFARVMVEAYVLWFEDFQIRKH